MLAYVFWHRPGPEADVSDYERAVEEFHRSLAHNPPQGLRGSASVRLAELPFGGQHAGPAYEDWYVIEDHTALGVLGEAAVGHGHRSRHDRAARHTGWGQAGLYSLLEGEHMASTPSGPLAVWVTPAAHARAPELAGLLADGCDGHTSLWRRALALGPAPEYCLLAGGEAPAGVAATRLPAGWSAAEHRREPIYGG